MRGRDATTGTFLIAHAGQILIPPVQRITVTKSARMRSIVMIGRGLLPSFALAALLAVLPDRSGSAASWLELNFYLSGPRYEGVLPPCDYQRALDKIADRFRQKEYKFWNPELAIVAFEDIRETAFRPWAANTIPRRFCSGIVEVSDGRRRAIHYAIAE